MDKRLELVGPWSLTKAKLQGMPNCRPQGCCALVSDQSLDKKEDQELDDISCSGPLQWLAPRTFKV
jgi:hypothetical protein